MMDIGLFHDAKNTRGANPFGPPFVSSAAKATGVTPVKKDASKKRRHGHGGPAKSGAHIFTNMQPVKCQRSKMFPTLERHRRSLYSIDLLAAEQQQQSEPLQPQRGGGADGKNNSNHNASPLDIDGGDGDSPIMMEEDAECSTLHQQLSRFLHARAGVRLVPQLWDIIVACLLPERDAEGFRALILNSRDNSNRGTGPNDEGRRSHDGDTDELRGLLHGLEAMHTRSDELTEVLDALDIKPAKEQLWVAKANLYMEGFHRQFALRFEPLFRAYIIKFQSWGSAEFCVALHENLDRLHLEGEGGRKQEGGKDEDESSSSPSSVKSSRGKEAASWQRVWDCAVAEKPGERVILQAMRDLFKVRVYEYS